MASTHSHRVLAHDVFLVFPRLQLAKATRFKVLTSTGSVYYVQWEKIPV
jgi:hypothetical protein